MKPISCLRTDLQDLAQLDEAQNCADISARLTTIDISLQGLEVTQQRQAHDPRLALTAMIQQRRLQHDLQRLAFDVLGNQALIKIDMGDNEPLPEMLARLPPQLIRLAQDYINQAPAHAILATDDIDESIYGQLVRLLMTDDTISSGASQDIT
ncbi:MAG: hypothetical protein ACI9SB_002799 [Candidatus Azotimanducaceae bacterium]|jgi:hypothetical protein